MVPITTLSTAATWVYRAWLISLSFSIAQRGGLPGDVARVLAGIAGGVTAKG